MSYDQFLLCRAVLKSCPGQLPFLTIKGHTSDFICQHSLVNIRLTIILCLRFLSVSKLQCQRSSSSSSRLSFDLPTYLPTRGMQTLCLSAWEPKALLSSHRFRTSSFTIHSNTLWQEVGMWKRGSGRNRRNNHWTFPLCHGKLLPHCLSLALNHITK